MPIQWFGAKFLRDIEARVDKGLVHAGEAVVSKARQYAPVDTGELRDSIRYEINGSGGAAKLSMGGWTTAGKTLTIIVDALYGMYQEFGTRYIPPHPYIRPALNEVGKVFGAELGMSFNVMPMTNPLYAVEAGFTHPPTLTSKQKAHVREHLLPASKRHYKGNVRKAKMKVRVA